MLIFICMSMKNIKRKSQSGLMQCRSPAIRSVPRLAKRNAVDAERVGCGCVCEIHSGETRDSAYTEAARKKRNVLIF